MSDWKGTKCHVYVYKYEGENKGWMLVRTLGIWMDLDDVVDIFQDYPIKDGYKLEFGP